MVNLAAYNLKPPQMVFFVDSLFCESLASLFIVPSLICLTQCPEVKREGESFPQILCSSLSFPKKTQARVKACIDTVTTEEGLG